MRVGGSFRHLWETLDARPALLPMLILLAGAAERILWLFLQKKLLFAEGEAANAAIFFARTGGIGNIFDKGSGLSAHLNPMLPAFAGSVYRLFGIRSPISEGLLAALSIGLALASAWFLYRVADRLGVSRRTRLIALALFCLAPFNIQAEAVTFRIWEGALAAALGGGTLLLIVESDIRRLTGWSRVTLISLLTAALFFINPAYGLAIYASATLLCVRRVAPRRWPGVVTVAAIALAAVLAPWTIRNASVFDRFIPLRSNMGLELALANHEAAAVGKPDDYTVFRARLDYIHPLQNGGGFERMVDAGGEIAYADALGAEAKRWIAENPADFIRLCGRHLRQFYFPPEWQWTIYSKSSRSTTIKKWASWLVTAFGLAGVALALASRRSLYLYAACVALLPSLPYIITQPVPRYRYLVFAPLLFFAVAFVDWCGQVIGARVRRPREADRTDRPAASSPDAPW